MNSESQSAAAFADSFASPITPGERDARKGERERGRGPTASEKYALLSDIITATKLN